nr:unnamed protein product [Callosobruchus chinensis]
MIFPGSIKVCHTYKNSSNEDTNSSTNSHDFLIISHLENIIKTKVTLIEQQSTSIHHRNVLIQPQGSTIATLNEQLIFLRQLVSTNKSYAAIATASTAPVRAASTHKVNLPEHPATTNARQIINSKSSITPASTDRPVTVRSMQPEMSATTKIPSTSSLPSTSATDTGVSGEVHQESMRVTETSDFLTQRTTRRRVQKKSLTVGSSSGTNGCPFKASTLPVRNRIYHVSRMDPATNVADLLSDLKGFTPSIQVEAISVKHPTHYSLFKLTVPEN